ncbi:unnamed protein product, partial [marine sediment metagenome]
MKDKKLLLIGSGVGVLLIIFIFLQSKRKLREGIAYDLSTTGEVFGLEGTGDAATQIQAPARALSIYDDPARSVIARKVEMMENSPITMTSIRQRYA